MLVAWVEGEYLVLEFQLSILPENSGLHTRLSSQALGDTLYSALGQQSVAGVLRRGGICKEGGFVICKKKR